MVDAIQSGKDAGFSYPCNIFIATFAPQNVYSTRMSKTQQRNKTKLPVQTPPRKTPRPARQTPSIPPPEQVGFEPLGLRSRLPLPFLCSVGLLSKARPTISL
jgi:hypothetical protein